MRAFSGVDGSVISDFIVSGSAFDNGIKVAAADITGDGKAEVVVGAGVDGGGRVRTYDPLTGTMLSGPLGNFRAFGTSYTGGAYVGSDSLAGDVNNDGTPDLVVGTGAGFDNRVKVFSGANGDVLYDFQPFGSGVTGGARVALAYVNDDAFADVVAGTGPRTMAQARVFSGATGSQLADPMGQYNPFGNYDEGVFVAATNDPQSPLMSWDTPPVASVVGQTVQVVVRATGMPPSPYPTGTVTLTAIVGSTNYTLGSATLVSTGSGYASTATINYNSLPAGTYNFLANYGGDSNFTSSVAGAPSITVSAVGTGVPADQPAGDSSCGCAGPVQNPTGNGGAPAPGTSAAGVNYKSGTVKVSRSDLSSAGYGVSFGEDWSWTNASGYADGVAGSGATQSQMPHLVQVNGNNSIAMVSNAQTARFFDNYGGAYHTRHGDAPCLERPVPASSW